MCGTPLPPGPAPRPAIPHPAPRPVREGRREDARADGEGECEDEEEDEGEEEGEKEAHQYVTEGVAVFDDQADSEPILFSLETTGVMLPSEALCYAVRILQARLSALVCAFADP